MLDEAAATRFWAKVTIGDPDECWPWAAAIHPNGYGFFWWNGKQRMAHRVAWMSRTGVEPPSHLPVRHRCDNRPCVNPSHLRIGTYELNVRDAQDRGRRPRVNPDSPYAPLLRWVNSKYLAALDGFD